MKTIRSEHHYTLVEIMTVIVIATILFGIGIPAFSTMIRGSNMTVAIRQLSAKIQAARAYAVTNHCKVAVLLAKNTGVRNVYCYSAYRVCVVDDSNVWQSWIEDEDWKTLPKGVLVLSNPNDYPAKTSDDPQEDVTKPDFKEISVDAQIIGGSATTTFSALILQKDGQMANSTSEIWLRQGSYVEGNSEPVYTERDSSGIINHPIEITKYTGKVKVKKITHASK